MSDTDAHRAQRDRLIESGLLLPGGSDGLYGRSGIFERIVAGLETLIVKTGADQDATVVRFPPAIAREVFVRTDYLRSFPTMTGSISTFEGDDRDHKELLRLVDAGGDWTEALVPADTVLCPAACHPLYPTIFGPLPTGGRRYDVYGWVFRHEPSIDPARMQAFRQYEYVYVGDPDGARAHRDRWAARGQALMSALEVATEREVANDPFFGRVGRMLAANQQSQELKYEILAPTSGADHPTAVISANCHEDHFGAAFGLSTADGAVAHTACVGFGVERITLALLWAHGLDPDHWPVSVRRQLWPS